MIELLCGSKIGKLFHISVNVADIVEVVENPKTGRAHITLKWGFWRIHSRLHTVEMYESVVKKINEKKAQSSAGNKEQI